MAENEANQPVERDGKSGVDGGSNEGTPAEALAKSLQSRPRSKPTTPAATPTPTPAPTPTPNPMPPPAATPAPTVDDDTRMGTIQAMIDAAVKPYKDRLAQVESTNSKREAERRGNDARDDYIQTHLPNVYPREWLRTILPATEDKQALNAAFDGLKKGMDGYIAHLVGLGRLKHVDIGGGNAGGLKPAEVTQSMLTGKPEPAASPQQTLAAALKSGG